MNSSILCIFPISVVYNVSRSHVSIALVACGARTNGVVSRPYNTKEKHDG